MDDNALTVIPAANGHEAALMPAMPLEAAIARKEQILEFTSKVMVKGTHFGSVPGIPKPMLFKAGAEMLCSYFGMRPGYEVVERIEQWGGPDDEPLFSYTIKCRLYHIASGLQVGEGDANCNSRETKYRWRWVDERNIPARYSKASLESRNSRVSEFAFAVEKAETTGQYGKPAAYWEQFQSAIDDGSAVATTRKTKA
ncbi:hypothetical protein LCGC14_2629950, partial [marine sediment metagenome]